MNGNDRGGFRPRSFAPVKVGEELDVTIEAVGEKGDGIAKKDGFVLFVPNVNEGDQVRIKITKVLRKVGFAEVIGSKSGKAKSASDEDSSEESEESSDESPSEDSESFGDEDSVEEPESPEESFDDEDKN